MVEDGLTLIESKYFTRLNIMENKTRNMDRVKLQIRTWEESSYY